VSVELKYDLYSDAFRVSTYATFAEMRERDPVLCQPGIDGETPIWFVTRYDDAVAVLLDDERFVRDPRLAFPPDQLGWLNAGLPDSFAFIDNHMLNKDGDDHRRLRRLVTKAFTPRMVERLRPRIQEIADELIDRVEARGEMDLVEEFAFPFPITVIAELLGVPAADRDRFRTWSNAIVTPALAADDVARFGELMQEFVDCDRERFEHPDTLALGAEREAKHVGFGRGSHYCLGAPLARLEAEVGLATLLRRLPDLRLAAPAETLAWRAVPLFRSLAALPVAWGTAV